MGDDEYVYTDEENRQLTVRLARLATAVHGGQFSGVAVGTEMLRELHRQLFRDIRDHAGLVRSATFGTEYLVFGPNRSRHRTRVREELEAVFAEARRTIAECEGKRDADGYARGAFHIAAWLHARIIEIHPFQDGNGRTARLMMNVVLVRLGLRPVAVEVPKDEYNAALNAFFQEGALETLIDVLLRSATGR